MTNKEKLINLSSPDANISELQSTYPKLYRAIKNLGDSQQTLINFTFPRSPVPSFRETFVLPGNPGVADDVLPYRYCVLLPTDSVDNWTYKGINLTACCITAKILGTLNSLSVDIKVKKRESLNFASLFKPGSNPILPPNTTYTNNAMFAISSLIQYDLLRVDVLFSDATISGISIDLLGKYIITEN
jgi:hypothetical protein